MSDPNLEILYKFNRAVFNLQLIGIDPEPYRILYIRAVLRGDLQKALSIIRLMEIVFDEYNEEVRRYGR